MNKWMKEECICCLRKKWKEVGRMPKKSDFDRGTVNRIKGCFGPWPKALEAAGIKKPNRERMERKREKRERAKRNQIRYRNCHPKKSVEEKEKENEEEII